MSNVKFCEIISNIEDSLSKWLSQGSIYATDRSKHLVWSYDDKINKRTLSIVFNEIHEFEDTIKQEYILNNGYILVVPSYWINIPKILTLEYILTCIVDYYGKELNVKFDRNDIENAYCQCPWIHPWKPGCVDKVPNNKCC